MGGSTLIKDAQKRMKNYYDDESSLPNDIPLAAEIPEEYGAPRPSSSSSSSFSEPSSPAASLGNNPWRIWQARPVQGHRPPAEPLFG